MSDIYPKRPRGEAFALAFAMFGLTGYFTLLLYVWTAAIVAPSR